MPSLTNRVKCAMEVTENASLTTISIALMLADEAMRHKPLIYEEVVAGVKAKIYSLFTASLVMKKSVEEIEQRFASPECKNNILLVKKRVARDKVNTCYRMTVSDTLTKSQAASVIAELF